MNLTRWMVFNAILCMAVPIVVSAYPLKAPKLMIVASSDGSALLRIDPGPCLRNASDSIQRATATVFSYDSASKTYQVTKTFALENPVSPTTAIISDRGEFIVTCDDWDPEIGSTANVVVVYRGSGELVKKWALEDIFSVAEIARFGPLADNMPVRHWRGENVLFLNDSERPTVSIPCGLNLRWQVGLHLDLNSLTFTKFPRRQSDK